MNQHLLDKIIPIDLGFGYGKSKFRGKEYREPSVLGEPRTIYVDSIKENDLQYGKVYIDEKTKQPYFEPMYFVGDLAVRHSNIRYYSTGDNKFNNWTTGIQLETIIGQLAKDTNLFVVTGLPLDSYFEQLPHMQRFLDLYKEGKPYALKIGHTIVDGLFTKIEKYFIVPQPIGACMNYLLDETGKFNDRREASQTILVGDLGFHTFDLLVYSGGEVHRLSKGYNEISIASAYTLIYEWLKKQTAPTQTPDLFQLDQAIIQGHYQGIDLRLISNKVFQSLANQISFAIDSLNIQYHRYIGTGGWSHEVTPLIGIPESKVCVFGHDGNIDGYTKIGTRICLTQ